MSTFVLAALRGLLIDLLATGDRSRVGKGFDLLARVVRDRGPVAPARPPPHAYSGDAEAFPAFRIAPHDCRAPVLVA